MIRSSATNEPEGESSTMDSRQKELWLTEFHLNGFVILPGFLPVDYVEAMREELAPLLDAEYAKAVEDDWSKGRARGRLSLHIAPFADLMSGALADERYRANPIIEELVDEIMGAGTWRRSRTVVEAVWQGAAHMGWHSDQQPHETPDLDAPHEAIRVTYNIPLVDFTWANGAIEFIPGSHRLPRNLVSPRLSPGDAILRDGNILHRGTPNLTDSPRPMLDQTYKKNVSVPDRS
jgi:hypothetical protein